MKTQPLKILMLSAVLAGSFVSCKKEDSTKTAIGIIVGRYSNGRAELFVQVDEKYPIGKTIEYIEWAGDCMNFIHDGIYQNAIRVQYKLPDISGTEELNKKISFSYRTFREEDIDLFIFGSGIGNALCCPPDIPLYVITKCRIIN